MRNVTIPRPVTQSDYVLHVLRLGHSPGVLSGAELQGKAKRYGAGYARRRRAAEEYAASQGIVSRLLLIDSRWSRVWSDSATGERVRILLEERA
jgi:hypothetical protein